MNYIFPEQHISIIEEILASFLRQYKLPKLIQDRIKVIIGSNQCRNASKIASDYGVSTPFVIKWKDRAGHFFSIWQPEKTKQETQKKLLIFFDDAPRSGAPLVYNEKQLCNVIALALQEPEKFNRPITHWTHEELADEAHKQNIAGNISKSTIGRLLKNADIKPHKSRYWLNPKITDKEQLKREISKVCDVYKNSSKLAKEFVNVISVDEKTGIQALERIHDNKPMKQGLPESIEFEYKRHGTLCLTPSFNVLTGKIDHHTIAETRDENDFADHIKNTVSLAPEASWIFVSDQLNTHKSESLVRFISEACELKDDLGVKGKSGILQSMDSRMEFLSNEAHRIRFVYTPKHCSWLNQVEIWFGILSRKMLKRGSFKSKDELQNKMNDFIKYFNENLAKPFKWTYEGKVLRS